MIKNELHIAELLYRYLNKRLNKSEEDILALWRASSPANERVFEELCKKETYSKKKKLYDKFIKQNRYAEIQKQIEGKKRKKTYTLFIAAAAVLLILSTPLLFLNRNISHNNLSSKLIEEIKPGKSLAILQTSTGKKINLTEKEFEIVDTLKGTKVSNSNNSLEYSSSAPANKKKQEYNTLHVPKGGEYNLILSDGTKVWLNSESKLQYPVSFTSTSREVLLEGEAYFEVSKNPHHPFLINLREGVKIEVTGTAFNLRAYNDENYISTVLEEGEVTMHSSEEKLSLFPNSLATYNIELKTLKAKQVNTELYTAWRYGEFIFENATIEDILHSLSRWYNAEIIFEDDKVKHVRFSGSVKKYETINTLLQALKASKGIDFNIKNKKIYLRKT